MLVIVVNDIATLYPKKAKGVIKWFLDGLCNNVDTNKALSWIRALQSHPETPIDQKELLDVANLLNKNGNDKILKENKCR